MREKRKERLEKRASRKFEKGRKLAGKSLAAEEGSKKQKRLDKKFMKSLHKVASLKQKLRTSGGDDPYSRTVTKKREGMAVDGNEYGVDTKTITKTRGGKTVVKKKGKGTGYANPIKRTKDKTVMKDGVTLKSTKKTTYKKPKKMAKNIARQKGETGVMRWRGSRM